MTILRSVYLFFRAFLLPRINLAAENLALRQQIIVLQRSAKRPRIARSDRVFWAWLSELWPDWRSALIIVQLETVIKWHRAGFRLYWRWKSRERSGRPRKDLTIRHLIRKMSNDNLTWVCPASEPNCTCSGMTSRNLR